MLTQIINGKIFTPQGWLDEGSVLMRDNKILEVTNCDLALIGANLIDAKGMYIVPGFVCMHAHGGGGHDFTECTEEAFRTAVKAHQKHGATSIFPTLSSSPFSEIRQWQTPIFPWKKGRAGDGRSQESSNWTGRPAKRSWLGLPAAVR